MLQQRLGTDRDYGLTLYDAAGNPVTTFTGSEPLTAVIWPGDSEAPTATLAASWTDAPLAELTLTVSSAAIAALVPCPYPVLITVVAGGRTFEVWRGWLDLLAGTGGSALAIPVYGQFSDLLIYGRSWIKQLLSADSTSGFAEERGRARTRLEEILLARWRPIVPGMHRDLLDGIGWWTIPEAPNQQLMTYLASNFLIVRPKTLEIVSRLALSYILKETMGGMDAANPFYQRGVSQEYYANMLIGTYVAEIDINADGLCDFAINCGVINTRRSY